MMKKATVFVLAACLLIAIIPAKANAAADNDKARILWLDNGDYIVITVENDSTPMSRGSKSGSTTYQYTNALGNVVWTAKLTGSFTYNGTTSTCTSANLSISVKNSSYYVKSQTSHTSGNTAYGSFTIGHKVLGITVDTDDYSLSLTCDANGNLS